MAVVVHIPLCEYVIWKTLRDWPARVQLKVPD